MAAGTFLSFAYGSNMLTTRLCERCPSAMPLGVAKLKGYELRWQKRSNDGSSKCDIVAVGSIDTHVFGVVYQIAISEKQALDEAEGLGVGYKEIDVWVVCKGEEASAKAYRAINIDAKLKPYTWYRAFVIAGAKEHGLPNDYIDGLSVVVASEDADRERHNRNMRLIPEALR